MSNKLLMMIKKLILTVTAMALTAIGFCQKPDTTLIPYRQGTKWGFANAEKKVVIKPIYDEVNWFFEGFAVIKRGTKYGYINKAGKIVIPVKYTVAKPFRFGYIDNVTKQKSDTVLFAGASIQADGYEICINTRGQRLLKCPAINENTDAALDAAMVIKEKVYTLNTNSKLFDKIVDDYTIAADSNTYFIARKDSLYGVFNNKFEVIVPFEYTSITKFISAQHMYLGIKKNGVKTILHGNGSKAIAGESNILQNVQSQKNEHLFIVSANGKVGVKDITNAWFIEPKYNDISYDENGGFVITDENDNKGFYFMDKTVVAPQYRDIKMTEINSRYLLVKTKGDKKGYVNQKGDEFFTE